MIRTASKRYCDEQEETVSEVPSQKCYVCGSTDHHYRPGNVRDDAGLQILECQNCGLVFLSRTELPAGFYEQSRMHAGEPQPIDGWLRETDPDDERRFQYLSEAITNREILDFGCGNGGFLKKARTCARRVTGIELEHRVQPHLKANYLDVFQSIDDLPKGQCFDLITAFHVVEHLEDPADMLGKLAQRFRGGVALCARASLTHQLRKEIPNCCLILK